MMPAEELRIDIPGLTLAAKAWGPAEGPNVLALHGWLDNAATYDLLAPLLPGVRLVALELPGHGLSQHRAIDAVYHFSDWVPSVILAADALGWSRFSLMGHSMGAGIAALTAGTFPDRIDRLVLIEGLGPFTSEAHEMPERLASYVTECQRLTAKQPTPHRDRDALAERMCKVVAGLPLACARILVERGTQDVPGGVQWRYDRRLRGTSSLRLTEAQVLAFFSRIACPALLVLAAAGYPFDAAQMEARCAAIRTLTRVALPGGHHVHMEHPRRVAALLEPFLRLEKPRQP